VRVRLWAEHAGDQELVRRGAWGSDQAKVIQ
jgi:hypothetical protein